MRQPTPFAVLALLAASPLPALDLKVTDKEYLDAPGLSVVLYHNVFDGTFGDQKMSALEIILHDNRIATNGDVRLLPTPEQSGLRSTNSRRRSSIPSTPRAGN